MPFYIWSHFQSWQTQSRLSFLCALLEKMQRKSPQLTSRMMRRVVTSSIITREGWQIPTSIWMSLSHRCRLEPDVIKTQVCCRIIWSGTSYQLYSLPPAKKVISRFFFMAGGKGEWLTEKNNNKNDKNSCYMTLLKHTLMICSCTPSSVCVPWKQLQIVSTNLSISLLPGLSRALPVMWPYAMSFYKWQILPKSKKHSSNVRCLIS